MKLLLLLFVNLIFINRSFSQYVVDIKFEIAKRRATHVDVAGNFGADTARRESIKRRLNTRDFVYKGAKRGIYTVRIFYTVDKDGNVNDVSCEKDPGYGMGAQSVRAVKASSKWASGPVRAARSTYIPLQLGQMNN